MNIKEKFLDYVGGFPDKDCFYKVEHTFRVVSFAKEIAKSLGLNKEDLYLVELASILHDIGRFEQKKKYNTFIDYKSKYHGDIGVEVLLHNDLIDEFCKTPEEKSIVLKTCKYHGTLTVPENLLEKEKLIINIVRDSDKIDILNNALLGNIKLDIGEDKVSKEVLEDFYHHKPINIKNKKSRADRLVVWLAFTYDFNFKYTYQYLKEYKIFDKLIKEYTLKTKNKECQRQYQEMNKEINEYIERRLKNVR